MGLLEVNPLARSTRIISVQQRGEGAQHSLQGALMPKLFIICLSGQREKLQFAAMTASVAAVSGT